MDAKTEKIIAEILGRDTGWQQNLRDDDPMELSPGFEDLSALAQILASDPLEDKLQEFLQFRPKLLMGFAGWRYSGDLALLVKPSVGIRKNADFAILQADQAGAHLMLVELERSGAALFTQKGTPAKTLQTALGQVSDWQQWLSSNYRTFVQETMSIVKELPLYPDRTHNGSCRFRSNEEIEHTWSMYQGYESAILRYVIVTGRWAELSDSHRKRLLFLNAKDNDTTIYTYDEIGRRAYARPFIRG